MIGSHDKIGKALEVEDWQLARSLIEEELANEPTDPHWLLSRLGTTFYEQFEYQRARELELQALRIAPDCPLALWGYACSLDMLELHREALAVYGEIVGRGVDSIAYGDCGEGRSWARGVIVDSMYRMAKIYLALGDKAKSEELFIQHLAGRGPGCRSIYSIRIVRRELKAFQK